MDEVLEQTSPEVGTRRQVERLTRSVRLSGITKPGLILKSMNFLILNQLKKNRG